MKQRQLRVGMLGAGGISKVHCEGWTRLRDCRLVAIMDVRPEAARQRAEEFKIESIEPTAARLIARKDIDVIDIVAPNRFHKPYTVAALGTGKHVLCEKPLAMSAREVDAMIEASLKAHRKLMCAQHERFQPMTLALKDYTRRHPLGQVYYARAWYIRRRMLPVTAASIYKRNSGGGPVIDVGVHILDLAMHLMDNFHPVLVSGMAVAKLAKRKDTWSEWGTFDKKGFDVEDFAVALVRFANGAALSLECSWMSNIKQRYEKRVDLLGTEGGARWPECEYISHTSRGFADTSIEIRDPREAPHHAEIRHFAEAIMGNTAVLVQPQQSRMVMATLEALYKSQRTGREVSVSQPGH